MLSSLQRLDDLQKSVIRVYLDRCARTDVYDFQTTAHVEPAPLKLHKLKHRPRLPRLPRLVRIMFLFIPYPLAIRIHCLMKVDSVGYGHISWGNSGKYPRRNFIHFMIFIHST